MTVAEVAHRLRRHPVLVQRWLREGRLKGEKVGDRVWMVRESELARFRKSEPERRKRT